MPDRVGAVEEPLWHPVPRLDAPDRVWLLPAPQAKWLGAGVFSAAPWWRSSWPSSAGTARPTCGACPPSGRPGWWASPWAPWGPSGAPGGLHLGRWASALVDWLLVPRHAVWRP